MTLNPRARALDLAIPIASCASAGVGSAHLTADLSRDELAALVDVLAAAASPVAVRDYVRDPGSRGHRDAEGRARLTKAAHTQAEACRKAGRPVPPHLEALEREYWRDRKRAQRDAAAKAAAEQLVLDSGLEPCPSRAAYRRHKRRGEPFEECGCGEAAREAWREAKRPAGQEQQRGQEAGGRAA